MSGTGGADIVHGAGLPSPRWWRRYRDIPLVILTVLSLIAAIVGWVTQYRIDSAAAQPAAVTATPGAEQDEGLGDVPARHRAARHPALDRLRRGQPRRRGRTTPTLSRDPVVLGRDGWAFYNDQIEENFSQAVGRRYLTVAEVAAWHDYFSSLESALADQGIELSIQISPSASSVYPEQLPEWTDGIVGSTPLDQFLAASPDLPIVDFRHDLRVAAETETVYTPVNSHWTDWGGYIAWQTYAACHDAKYPSADPLWVPAVDGVESTRIYNEYAPYGVPDAEPAWTVPVFSEAFADVEVTAGRRHDSHRRRRGRLWTWRSCPRSRRRTARQTTQEALIMRDSMGNALTPYWGQAYAKTWQIQHRYDDWSDPPNYRALVDQYQPDVVIVQLAERHLANAAEGRHQHRLLSRSGGRWSRDMTSRMTVASPQTPGES